jgi:capsular polysaccharide biosynthesis protein
MDLEMPRDNKYLVYHLEDMERFVYDLPAGWLNDDFHWIKPIQDAVVLRRQDLFASVALRAYAGAVLNALDVLDQLGMPSVVIKKRLLEIADYFNAQADMAERDNSRKVPD